MSDQTLQPIDVKQYFHTSLEHILARLEWLDNLLRIQLERFKQIRPFDDRLQGLYVTDKDINELLTRPLGYPAWGNNQDIATHYKSALEHHHSQLLHLESESQKQGVRLRLVALQQKYGLSTTDVDLLLIALAPEIDLRYEKLYGYLQDDVTRKRPSIELALNVLSAGGVHTLNLRSRLSPHSPLIRHGLIQLTRDSHQLQAAYLSDALCIHLSILRYLLELPGLDGEMQICCTWSDHPGSDRLASTTPSMDEAKQDLELPLSSSCRTLLKQGMAMLKRQQSGCLYLQGDAGVGQADGVVAIARHLSRSLLTVDLSQVIAIVSPAKFAIWWRDLTLAAWQNQALLYLISFDAIASAERTPLHQQLESAIADYDEPIVVAGTQAWPFTTSKVLPFVIPFTWPDFELRKHLWTETLVAHNLLADPSANLSTNASTDVSSSTEMIGALSDRFRLNVDQIRSAVAQAQQVLQWSTAEVDLPLIEQCLFEAARTLSGEQHLSLAKKIRPRFTWNDIVLLPEQTQLLQALCNQVTHRPQVYNEWGFGRKLVLGKGVSALFAGPPGTGKTMAAEVMAHTLQLDLYKIDLSQVVNKYIGETEKNLSRIFDVAEQSNAILLFDEADALFGKRSEVKDSHDRYANLEVAYLLQKMEEYEGISILTTNLRQNLDDAFTRRIRFIIDFPFPEAKQRLKIWQAIWPQDLPLSDDIKFQELAREFKLAGGSIRNIALGAAFLAAADAQSVQMVHLLKAIRQELQKMGRLVSEETFTKLLV
ncbi:MAG: ATP-binding protein [Cyanobacteria bacterium P01_F01_bin.150]